MILKQLAKNVKKYFRILVFQDKWRKQNSNNSTKAGNIFPIDKVSIGKHTYGTLNVHCYNQPEEHLSIGAYCSIADNTCFMLGGEHDYKTLMTYPFKNRITKNEIQEAITKGPIVIEDDVWIGCNCIILSGTHIGQGAVIGAGSVVSGSIPPYAIFAGGRVVKYRFAPDIMDKLSNFKPDSIQWEKAKAQMDLLYTHINEENIEQVLEKIKSIQELPV